MENNSDVDFIGYSRNNSNSNNETSKDSYWQLPNGNISDIIPEDTTSNNQSKIFSYKSESVDPNSLSNDLRQCFLEENITHSAGNRILQILKKHKKDETLPKDIRTLLGNFI